MPSFAGGTLWRRSRLGLKGTISTLEGVGFDVPDDVRNYPKSAWQQLAQSGGVAETAGSYVSRTDDAGRSIPHVCFKVPTGGGKTLLAAAALERLNRQAGLTLWITPTRAIYEQTKIALRNREHFYRHMLERASGGGSSCWRRTTCSHGRMQPTTCA